MEKQKLAKVKKLDWKKMDLKAACRNDIAAAISVLDLILNKPELFQAVVTALEQWRNQMIENEKNKAQA